MKIDIQSTEEKEKKKEEKKKKRASDEGAVSKRKKNRQLIKSGEEKKRSKLKFAVAVALFGGFVFLLFSAPTHFILFFFPDAKELTRDEIYERFFNIPEPTYFFSESGQIIGELFERYAELVPYSELPEHLIHAFLAAEDEDFFKHRGVNPKAILRALIENIKERRIVQGGSTITQQLARNLFLSRERTLTRKIKEAAYALKIEEELTKQEILSLYLSSIFFGNGSWGIKSAARNYFGKSVSELTVAESALLASLPKSPVYYSPIRYPEKARKRQLWVLKRMKELGFISDEEYESAKSEKIKIFVWKNKLKEYFWYSEFIRRKLIEIIGDSNEIKRSLSVFTSLDTDCYKMAEKALRWGLERAEVVNQAELAEKLDDVEIKVELEAFIFPDGEKVYNVKDGLFEGEVIGVKKLDNIYESVKLKVREIPKDEIIQQKINSNISEEEKSQRSEIEKKNKKRKYKIGYILTELTRYINFKKGQKFILKKCGWRYYCPVPKKVEVEGAIVVINPQDGRVLCMVGGYDAGRSQFIRSVQAKRQVGSAFKPIVYAAALESRLFTPATLVKDTPIIIEEGGEEEERNEKGESSKNGKEKGRADDKNKEVEKQEEERQKEWKPKNFSRFHGFITLQEALAKSINVATVRVAQEIGILRIKEMMRRLGIREPGPPDLTIALGSISLSPLELASAYIPFANGGKRITPYFIRRIERRGEVLYENDPEPEQVISPQLAFLMAWMMRNVVLHGTGWRAKALGMPVAGKTGTSDLGRDAWFVGFTPEVVVAVWVGRDDFTPIGEHVASGPSIALPIFVKFMRQYKKKLKKLDFEIPEGIEFAKVDPITGEISTERFYIMAFRKDDIPLNGKKLDKQGEKGKMKEGDKGMEEKYGGTDRKEEDEEEIEFLF